MLPELPCLCANFRRASRALTQQYEEALRVHGLRATQFTILQVLSRAGEVSQGQLGRMLAMDSTTLTRTLGIMMRNVWLTESRGKDRRERHVRLSKSGEALFHRAVPAWEEVQKRLRSRLGERAWQDLLQLTHQVTDLITTEGESL